MSRDSIVVARSIAAIGLIAVALVHILDLQSKFEETPYQGYLFLLLGVVSIAAAGRLIHGAARSTWLIAAAAGAGPLLGYVLSRSVGLPDATDDIGNWWEPLGLASMVVEVVVLLVSVRALAVPRVDHCAEVQAVAPRVRDAIAR